MNQTATLDTPTEDVAALQAGITQCLTDIDLLREQMQSDEAEIDRSRRRTRTLLAELKASVSSAKRGAA